MISQSRSALVRDNKSGIDCNLVVHSSVLVSKKKRSHKLKITEEISKLKIERKPGLGFWLPPKNNYYYYTAVACFRASLRKPRLGGAAESQKDFARFTDAPLMLLRPRSNQQPRATLLVVHLALQVTGEPFQTTDKPI